MKRLLCCQSDKFGEVVVVVASVVRRINWGHICLRRWEPRVQKALAAATAPGGECGSQGVTGSLRLSNSHQQGLGQNGRGAEEQRGGTICHFHCRRSTSDAATPAVKLYECFCWASSTPTAFIRQAPRLFFLPPPPQPPHSVSDSDFFSSLKTVPSCSAPPFLSSSLFWTVSLFILAD